MYKGINTTTIPVLNELLNKVSNGLLGNQTQSQLRQQVTLICLGLISCLLGFLIHQFIPDVYAPISVFLLAAGIAFGVVIASLLFESVLKYLNDLVTFAYLFMYLSTVYLAFTTNFEPHLTLLLLSAHVFFSLSFQSFSEFTLFAISSLVLLILSIHTSAPLYFDRHMLVSTLTLITMGAGIANWYTINKRGIQDEYRNLLSTFLNRHSDAIFLLSDDTRNIIFLNAPGRKFVSFIFKQEEVTGQALLDILGLNKQFLLKRFQSANYHVQERCICHLNVEMHQPLKLEIFINKVHIRQGDAFMLTLRDSISKAKMPAPWVKPSANGNGEVHEHKEALTLESVNLKSLVDILLENLKNQAIDEKTQFVTQVPNMEDFITDVTLLSSALKHLLLSIIHQNKINGSTPHIYIGVNLDDKFLKFIIQDNGGSISERMLKVAQSKIASLESQLFVLEASQTGNIFTFSLPLHIKEGTIPH